MVSTLGVSSDDNGGSFIMISEYIHISLQFPLISTVPSIREKYDKKSVGFIFTNQLFHLTTMIYCTDASTKKRFVGLYALNNFEIDHNDYLLWNAHRS